MSGEERYVALCKDVITYQETYAGVDVGRFSEELIEHARRLGLVETSGRSECRRYVYVRITLKGQLLAARWTKATYFCHRCGQEMDSNRSAWCGRC